MLLKKSTIILNTLISLSAKMNIHTISNINDLIKLLPQKYTWNYNDVSTLLCQLIDESYIEAELFYHGEYPIPDYRSIVLTYKGKHYKEFNNKLIKDFLLKSVLIPIIISLITSAITTFIGYIWGSNMLNNHANKFENTSAETIDRIIDTANP